MKTVISLFFLFFACTFTTLTAQVTKVTYLGMINDNGDLYGTIRAVNGILLTDKLRSFYSRTPYDTIIYNPVTEQYLDSRKQRWEFDYYKNLKTQTITYQDYTTRRKLLISDTTYAVDWVMGKQTKNILGYVCQSASGHFRGRDYTVYFASEIPIRNGPFKFDGLPGLIMEVDSDDGAVHIQARGIEFNVDDTIPKNPFVQQKTVTWEAYQKIYRKWFRRITNFYDSQKGTTLYIPKRFIEVVVPDDTTH